MLLVLKGIQPFFRLSFMNRFILLDLAKYLLTAAHVLNLMAFIVVEIVNDFFVHLFTPITTMQVTQNRDNKKIK